ncbi:hypothetical protein BKA70DRAFT_1096803 [Coprinopsis sp. MPI-PUGE-AT-0042]|nr:hypothetical protein BKA70DRAFT_1096803 [Coprinopsis sp. MPI-PUGE-AT-0042]
MAPGVSCLPYLDDDAQLSAWPTFLQDLIFTSSNKADSAPAEVDEQQQSSAPKASKPQASQRPPAVDGCLERLTEMPVDIVYEFCSAKGVQDVYWVCRVRCCSNCVKNEFISQEELECWIPEELSQCTPDSIFPYATIAQCNKEQPEATLYFAPTAREYLAELSEALGNPDGKGVERWIRSKTDIQAERVKHAEVCEQWYNLWVDRPIPSYFSRIPLFDMSVTLVLTVALVYLWKDKLLG